MNEAKTHQTAAIVCSGVANDHKPILYGERSEPEEETDSGWQFLCGAGSENWEAAQVWSLSEVLAYEPSLAPFVNLPSGTVVYRKSSKDSWQKVDSIRRP